MTFNYDGSIYIEDVSLEQMATRIAKGETFEVVFEDIMAEYDDCIYYSRDYIYDDVKEVVMLRAKEKNRKIPTSLVTSNYHTVAVCNLIENIIRGMKLANCNTLESSETGEIITLEGLKRTLGILSGFDKIDLMY